MAIKKYKSALCEDILNYRSLKIQIKHTHFQLRHTLFKTSIMTILAEINQNKTNSEKKS